MKNGSSLESRIADAGLWLAGLLSGCLGGLSAQPAPSHRPNPRSWTDSTARTPEARVFRIWQEYLRSKSSGLAANAGTPSDLWVKDEQAKWPMYDLAGFYVSDDATPEVIAVKPVAGAGGREYEIVTRFLVPDSTATPQPFRTALTISVFATQQGKRWLLANALPRRTRSWRSEKAGQITYFIEPGLSFNRPKADRAVAFVDSLATALEVPRLGALDYYVTATVDGALHAIGVDYPTTFGPGGGFAKPVNRQLFAAVPLWGEEYRHELAHLVVLPLLQQRARTMSIIATEGFATWLGGTAGMELGQAVQGLRAYLSRHPAVALDSALTPGVLPQTQTYAAGAVLCDLIFRHGGTSALKQFLVAGPGAPQLRAALVSLLQRPWERIVLEWREAVDRMADQPPSPMP